MDPAGPDRFSTRFVELRRPNRADGRTHRSTLLLPPAGAPPAAYFRLCFLLNYDALRLACCRHPLPGVAVVAIDDLGVVATAWLGAKYGQINTAIIGRHHAADICLADDDGLSLRHLALITRPLRAGQDVRFRILDLRTQAAFTDERGRRLGAIEAEGPAFICCGRYCLIFIPTGDDTPWPADPDTGWQCIPERVYLDEVAAEPDRWQRPRHYPAPPKESRNVRQTFIRTCAPPLAARRRLLTEGEQPLGELHVQSGIGHETLSLGSAAAATGVLLGRYDRCDNQGLHALCSERISRVHCLLLEVDGTLYVVDVASTNGTHVEHPDPTLPVDRVRILPLAHDVCFSIGMGQVRLRWRSLH